VSTFSVSLEKITTEDSSASKGDRPFSEVWDGHMIKGSQTSRGHYSAKCAYCSIFNRYAEFDDDIYLLAVYLHPQYRGNYC
jgi:hypothetical protein